MTLSLAGFETVQVGHDGTRRPDDYYPTPRWCTEALMPVLAERARGGVLLEPAIGHGAIASVLADVERYGRRRWRVVGCDINAALVGECVDQGLTARCADFLRDTAEVERWALDVGADRHHPRGLAAIVGNPPYSLAREFVDAALSIATPSVPGRDGTVIAFLLRLGFLSSQERAAFHHQHPCDVLVLDSRPSFTGNGKGGKYDYGWMLWPASVPGGRIWRTRRGVTGCWEVVGGSDVDAAARPGRPLEPDVGTRQGLVPGSPGRGGCEHGGHGDV